MLDRMQKILDRAVKQKPKGATHFQPFGKCYTFFRFINGKRFRYYEDGVWRTCELNLRTVIFKIPEELI